MNPHIRLAGPDDASAAVAVLDAALSDDPFVTWLVAGRPSARRAYVELMLTEIALPRGLVQVALDGEAVVGAALWAPPRSFSLSAWDSVRLMPRMLSIIGWGRMRATSAKLDEIEQARPPEPYWLLTLLGIHPEHRRRGLGSALLGPILARCDEEDSVCACETAAAHNVTFYERHGFEVQASRPLAPGGPTSWSLWRSPAAASTAVPAPVPAAED